MKPEDLSNYRLRALELSIGSSERPVTTEGILDRAAQFAGFIAETENKVQRPPNFDPRTWTFPTISGYIVDIVGRLEGCRISPTDSEYLIDCIRSRTY